MKKRFSYFVVYGFFISIIFGIGTGILISSSITKSNIPSHIEELDYDCIEEINMLQDVFSQLEEKGLYVTILSNQEIKIIPKDLKKESILIDFSTKPPTYRIHTSMQTSFYSIRTFGIIFSFAILFPFAYLIVLLLFYLLICSKKELTRN